MFNKMYAVNWQMRHRDIKLKVTPWWKDIVRCWHLVVDLWTNWCSQSVSMATETWWKPCKVVKTITSWVSKSGQKIQRAMFFCTIMQHPDTICQNVCVCPKLEDFCVSDVFYITMWRMNTETKWPYLQWPHKTAEFQLICYGCVLLPSSHLLDKTTRLDRRKTSLLSCKRWVETTQ